MASSQHNYTQSRSCLGNLLRPSHLSDSEEQPDPELGPETNKYIDG